MIKTYDLGKTATMNTKDKIIEIVKANQPITQWEIRAILRENEVLKTEREIRRVIKTINQDFVLGKQDFIIASNSNGMFISTEYADIKKLNTAKKHLAMSLLKSAYDIEKRVNKNKNMSFTDFLGKEEANEFMRF